MNCNRQATDVEADGNTEGRTDAEMDERPSKGRTVTPGPDEMDYSDELRRGGWFGIVDNSLIVVHDGDGVAVGIEDVAEVTAQDIDRFVGLLSLVLVGFGIWGTTKNPLAGIAFALAGAVSVYLTYRKRNRLTISVAGRPKPIRLYPANAGATYAAVTDAISED